MTQKIKRPVSILLAMLMVVSLFTAVPISASAATGVTYLDADGATQTCSSYETFTGQTTIDAEGETKWYVAESNYSYSPSSWDEHDSSTLFHAYGDVHLIVKDGVKVNPESVKLN